MFGRKKNKDVDWQSSLGQPVPAQPSPAPAPEAAAPIEVPGLTKGQARMVNITTRLAGTPNIQVIGGASQEQVKQAMDMAEKFMNADLDGDGKVAGGAPAAGGSQLDNLLYQMNNPAAPPPVTPAPAAPAAPDVVGQLERLAKLHETGALTDEEFATEKAKLLGS